MTTVDLPNFRRLHAHWYDRWHGTKDYRSEVDQIIRVFGQESGAIGSVLDIGCGTARHLALLAEAGYDVTGVDRSPAMLEVAAQRLAPFGSRARVVESEGAALRLDRTFDAAIMMFSVFGYIVPDDARSATLAMLHRHLRPDGLLVFDVLDAAAVLRNGALGGLSVVEDGDEQLLRVATGKILKAEQVYQIGFRMWALHGDSVLAAAEEETHPIRYYLPRELELVLDQAGFTLLGSEPLAGGQPGPTREWARLFWARRRNVDRDGAGQ